MCPILADGLHTLTLSNATGATSIGTPNPATLTIQDDDVVSAGFSSATYTAAEGDGTATIQVDLGGVSAVTVTIDYVTSNGTATSGSDYTATNGTLTFAPGDTSQTFDVSITDDASVEDSETVTLTLSNPSNASLSGTNPATLTITDNDVPSVSFASATYNIPEGDPSATTIYINLSEAGNSTITVNYATSDGSATAGSDYTAASGTLTFNVGETQRTITNLPVIDDTTVECGNETVNLTLSNPNNATLGATSTTVITIVENDGTPPTASTSAATRVGESSATLNGTLSNMGSASSVDVSFAYGTSSSCNIEASVETVTATGDFSVTLNSLNPGQRYYFRATAAGDCIASGDTLNFMTNALEEITPDNDDEDQGDDSDSSDTQDSTDDSEPESIASDTGEATLPLNDEGTVEVEVTITSEDSVSTIVIPEGTTPINDQGEPQDESITCQPSDIPEDAPPADNVIAVYDYGPDGTTFDQPVTITMSYDPAEIPEGVAEEDLIIAFFDESTGEWVPLDDIVVDTENNTISGTVTHFTIFGILWPEPTVEPVVEPTAEPTAEPTTEPVIEPTAEPTAVPVDESDDDSTPMGLIIGLAIFGFVLLGLGIYFLVIRRREMA